MSLDRREFLKLGGVGVAGILFIPLLEGCESHVVTPLRALEETRFLTPIGQFFEQNGGEGAITGWTYPTFNSEQDWSLTIKENNTVKLVVTWDDLMAAANEESITILKTIECVLQSRVRVTATGYTGSAYWTGVPLKRFLDQSGIDYTTANRIKQIVLTGADGFNNNVKPVRITNAEADGLEQPLLVYQMNGLPLPPKHGFPIRLIINEGYGYKNIKWITEVQALTIALDNIGTYQDQGFVDDGIMRTNSRSTNVFEGIEIASGSTLIAGFALSGFAPIEKVEVQIDGGAPQLAEIVPLEEIQTEEILPATIKQLAEGTPYPFRGVWTPWRLQWQATRGDHTIAIRAFDTAGNFQPDVDDDGSDGQTGVTIYKVKVS